MPAFWGEESFFSNHYRTHFAVDGTTYNSVEQYLMYSKANSFGDSKASRSTLEAESWKNQMKLEKRVRCLDRQQWVATALAIAFCYILK